MHNFFSDIKSNKRKQKLFCLVLSLTGFGLNALAYYPGFMSTDSFDQYSQALTNHYHDWHPPVMAALWHCLLIFHNGPQGMFFFQLLLLWTSFYLIGSFFLRHYFNTFFLVLLFVFAPFIQNFVGVVWKDTEMALAWLVAVAILLRVVYENRTLNHLEKVVCLLLLSYGCWLRFNALPGAIPLVLLFVSLSSRAMTWFRLLAGTGLILLSMYFCQLALNYFVIKPERVYPENKIYMQDLTGIYVKTGKNYYPHFITSYAGYDSAYLKKKYSPASFDHIWWNFDGKDLFPVPFLVYDADSSKTLRRQWLKAIGENKEVYLENRYSGFLNYLRIKNRTKTFYSEFPYISENTFGIEFKPNAFSHLFVNSIHAQKDFFYMRPWFWSLVNLLILLCIPLSKSLSARKVILTLTMSGLLYLLPQFFVFQIDTDFRYFYWNCISVSLALILFISEFIAVKTSSQ